MILKPEVKNFHNRKVKSSLDSRIDVHHDLEVRPYKKLELLSKNPSKKSISISNDLKPKSTNLHN